MNGPRRLDPQEGPLDRMKAENRSHYERVRRQVQGRARLLATESPGERFGEPVEEPFELGRSFNRPPVRIVIGAGVGDEQKLDFLALQKATVAGRIRPDQSSVAGEVD